MAKKKVEEKKEEKPKAPKVPPKLTPEQCKLAGDYYEDAALKVQEMYTYGSTVTEAVKVCLARANLIRAGRVE